MESVLSDPAHRSSPGFVLSFFLIENLLWKQQLCPLMSQETVNVHFSKIRKTAKEEGQEEKGKFFGVMCLFVLTLGCPEYRRAVRQLHLPHPLGTQPQPPQTSCADLEPCNGQRGQRVGRAAGEGPAARLPPLCPPLLFQAAVPELCGLARAGGQPHTARCGWTGSRRQDWKAHFLTLNCINPSRKNHGWVSG